MQGNLDVYSILCIVLTLDAKCTTWWWPLKWAGTCCCQLDYHHYLINFSCFFDQYLPFCFNFSDVVCLSANWKWVRTWDSLRNANMPRTQYAVPPLTNRCTCWLCSAVAEPPPPAPRTFLGIAAPCLFLLLQIPGLPPCCLFATFASPPRLRLAALLIPLLASSHCMDL